MPNQKILMLGWEFPPLLNGGLGIASLELCKALSRLVDISLILPRADQAYRIEQVTTYGMDEVEINEILEEKGHEAYTEFVKKTRYIDVNLDPYSDIKTSVPQTYEEAVHGFRPVTTYREIQYKKQIPATPTTVEKLIPLPVSQEVFPDIPNVFKVGPVYGDNLIHKVKAYAEYVKVMADEFDFDIIHAHDWMTFPAAMALKAITGKPLVAHVHSLQYDRSGLTQEDYITHIEREMMKTADRIIPVSRYTAGKLIQEYDCDVRKITHVHNGISWHQVERKAKPFPNPLVMFAGRLTQQKNPEMFVEVAEKVLEHCPDCRFVVVGDGDQYARVIERAASPTLIGKCHFTGYMPHEQVQEIFAMADVYCLTSNSEPFGLTALEAAMLGIPVILTNRAGAGEVLRSAPKVGIKQSRRMAQEIIALLKDDYHRAAQKEAAYMDLKNATWGTSAYKIKKIYQQIVAAQTSENTLMAAGESPTNTHLEEEALVP
ncbi:glycosyltransferase [Persicobacter sp. CCB-QB2]|uniref:glycosyltransferase n=1 Tax=Persicobacter sp. CCB-QB2 TaxID=1561025 RepID=UPI00155DA9B5|nr:glycosyltransferase [Persicobacter sp. CCB-QB2]